VPVGSPALSALLNFAFQLLVEMGPWVVLPRSIGIVGSSRSFLPGYPESGPVFGCMSRRLAGYG